MLITYCQMIVLVLQICSRNLVIYQVVEGNAGCIFSSPGYVISCFAAEMNRVEQCITDQAACKLWALTH